ncbi:hypothetical protein [Mycobacteroides salmoniphilum]|uniref:Uncharacterized protein n=1 Tax=Mycobacteroides salmoniphilum TaxID=404941 RepID=A0A4R8SZR0_9MYCO|nr:hypothetical protein [Mycobacteroides salmoniphilum]TEA09083.1 hypothetical protein CCUG60884_00252 [Mycobacteroides salmoniphilum]
MTDISTDELIVQVAHTRSNRPYLSVTDDEGNEIAAVSVAVDKRTNVVAIELDEHGDCSARLEVVEHPNCLPNKVVWRSSTERTS